MVRGLERGEGGGRRNFRKNRNRLGHRLNAAELHPSAGGATSMRRSHAASVASASPMASQR